MTAHLLKLKKLFQDNPAFRVALIYAGFATLWIIFSDQILYFFIKEAATLTRIQMLKGSVFILATAFIVYSLLHQEIAKLRQTEADARESERKLFTLMGNLPGMAYRCRNDTNRTLEFASSGCFGLTGYQPADLVDNRLISFKALIHPADQEMVREKVQLSLARRQSFQLTYRLLAADGEEKWVWEQGVGIFSETGEVLALEGFLTDITDQKRAEEAVHLYRDHLEEVVRERTATLKQEIVERQRAEEKIRKSYFFESTVNAVLKISLEPIPLEEQLARILDLVLAVPLLSLEKRGSIFLVEGEPEVLVMKAHRGYDEAVVAACALVPFGTCLCGEAAAACGPVFTDCLTECHACYREMFPHGHSCMPILAGGRVLGVLNLVVREGHATDEHDKGFLSSMGATLAGIIERKKGEAEQERLRVQLNEAEKLSALGRMMANVAHEIRNPLTALGGLARRLDKKVPAGTREKGYAQVIVSEAARLERILKSVMLFTKEPSIEREEADLNHLIEEALQPFAASVAGKSIEVRTSLTVLPAIPVNREDVKEVIGNLLANAVDAMPAGGRITIATEQEHHDGIPFVAVKITDTGHGIPEERIGMIFEPFFTTKPVGPGHGIGLGLSISRKIMAEHGGLIRVESQAGEGTSFTLLFPQAGPGANRPD